MIFGYTIIIPVITNCQKILFHIVRLLPSNKKKIVKIALPSAIKLLSWQPDMQYLDIFMLSLLRHIDVSILGFIYISINMGLKFLTFPYQVYNEKTKHITDFQKVSVLCYHGYLIWMRNSNFSYIFCQSIMYALKSLIYFKIYIALFHIHYYHTHLTYPHFGGFDILETLVQFSLLT